MQIEDLIIVNETSSLKTYRVKNSQTVQDVLKKLKLETKYFAILINGQKAELSTIIEENSEILILPKIAGG